MVNATGSCCCWWASVFSPRSRPTPIGIPISIAHHRTARNIHAARSKYIPIIAMSSQSLISIDTWVPLGCDTAQDVRRHRMHITCLSRACRCRLARGPPGQNLCSLRAVSCRSGNSEFQTQLDCGSNAPFRNVSRQLAIQHKTVLDQD